MKINTALACLLLVTPLSTFADDELMDHLMTLSLEELSMLDVEMNTASKTSKKLADIPASVFVLTNERIKRSGARTIVEALALVPGVTVSKYSETEWFVSARGFHDGLFNKLLVMMDGRSLYSPLYGGVYWTDLDYILADIDRIEVLRGPGGTIWGGNAVNGVINIITKKAQDTQSSYISGTSGRFGTNSFSVRQGADLGHDIYGRAFYKQSNQAQYLSNDAEVWQRDTAGVVLSQTKNNHQWDFRFGGKQTSFTQPWYINNYTDPNYPTYDFSQLEIESRSFYAQFNYEQETQNGGLFKYSLWANHNNDEAKDAPGKVTTVDFDTNYNFEITPSHNAIIGGGIRYLYLDLPKLSDELSSPVTDMYARYYTIDTAKDIILNAFYQSELQVNDSLNLVAGIKGEYFESNKSFEVSPQLRALYQFSVQHSAWVGVGRAVTAPSYLDSHSYYIQSNGEDVSISLPTSDIENESVLTTEIGYRYTSGSTLSLDSTIFYSDHANVRGHDTLLSYSPPSASKHDIYVQYISADYSAVVKGIELAAELQLLPSLSYHLAYTYVELDSTWEGGEFSNGQSEAWFEVKQHLTSLQMLWEVTDSIQFDITSKYQDTEYSDYYDMQIDPYFSFDVRLAWQNNSQSPLFELIVQDVNEKGYSDYYGEYPNEEMVYVRASYEF